MTFPANKEIVIAVIGVTGKPFWMFGILVAALINVPGSGKSSLIKEITGSPEVKVSHSLNSCKSTCS
jgi:hypothetical protein